MEILFLNHRDLEHYEKLHPALRDVLAWLYDYMLKRAARITYTSIFRHSKDDIAMGRSGIHGLNPGRAADVVILKKASGEPFTQYDYNCLATVINCIWYYGDKGKHLVAFADPHGTGPHIHLQARDGTQKRLIKET